MPTIPRDETSAMGHQSMLEKELHFQISADEESSFPRVAIYYELNSTPPTYAIGNMNMYYLMMQGLLSLHGYNVTFLTADDISNHELTLANYDVLILADNCPRERIFYNVKDFWRGGGGLLSYDSAASYLGMIFVKSR